MDIKAKVNHKDIKDMTETVESQAQLLKPDDAKDEALLKLLILGQNHHFPLLTYLVDTYTRFRLLKYQELYKQLEEKDGQKQKTKFIARKFNKGVDLTTFFKTCHALKQIARKKKTEKHAESALNWYDSSIKSFHRRLFGPLKMTPKQIIYKINDSMQVFAKYYISLLRSVSNIIKSANTQLPLQIDFVVIPRAMSKSSEFEIKSGDTSDSYDGSSADDDLDDVEEEEENDNDAKEINNLDKRFKFTENFVKKEIECKAQNIQRLSRVMVDTISDVVKGQRSKRMVMIIDRRKDGKNIIDENKVLDEKDDDEKDGRDKLYAYLPNRSKNIPKGRYLHESMFNLAALEVIPSDEETNAIHVVSDIPNLCTLSVQIHEESVIRAYWFINGSSTRFYLNDMVNIWPLYFIDKEFDKENEERIKQDTKEIEKLINENKDNMPLKDTNFDAFFKLNTKISSAVQIEKNDK